MSCDCKSENKQSSISYLKVSDIMERFNVSRSTVLRMIESKEIPAIRFGHNWRIPQSFIENIEKGLN